MAIRSRTSGSGAASSSHSVGLPVGVQVGDRLLVGFVHDQPDSAVIDTHTGWTSLGTLNQGTNLRLTVLTRVATGSDALTVTFVSAASQEAAWTAYCMTGNGGTPEVVPFSSGTASPADATAVTGLASGDYDSIIFLGVDNNGSPSHAVDGVPSGWTNLTTPGSNTAAVVVASMERSATGVTGFTPGAISFTNTADQWVSAHVVIAQAAEPPPAAVAFLGASQVAEPNTPDATADRPTGTAEGDLLIAVHVSDFDGALSSMEAPAGWSLVGSRDAAVTREPYVKIWRKIATSSEPTTYSFPDNDSAHSALGILRIEGHDPEQTLTAVFSSGTGSTSHVAPSVTGVADGLLVTIHTADTSSVSMSYTAAPPGMTERVDVALASGGYVVLGVFTQGLSAGGATGTKAATCNDSVNYVTASLVITPAGGGGVVPKDGGDTGTGAEAGATTAEIDSGDTGTGTEAGSLALSGADSGVGSEDGYVSEAKLGGDVGEGAETFDSSATVTSGEAATGAEAGTTSATLDPPADASTGAEQGHIAIPGGDEAEGVDAHDPPTLVTVTTGEETTGTEGGYVETLYGDLIVSLFVVDPETGQLIALPDYESLDISRERNNKGAIRTQYPIDGKDFALLRSSITDSRDLEFELWTNGTPTGALRGYLQEAAGDDVVADDNGEDGSWQFAGSFLEVRTDETLVFPQSLGVQIVDPDSGELVWTNPRRELIVNADNPGEIVTLLLQQAQARGALTDIVADFSTTHDSNGVPWAGVLTGRFSPGVTYTSILNKMVQLGLAEWAIVWDWENQRKVFRVWNAEGRGADLTLGPRPVTLRRGRNLLDAPRKWSVRDSATTMLAAGAEGLYRDTTDPTALARRDRRVEAYTSLNNAIDEEAVLGWAQAQLALVAPGFTSIEHGIGMLPGEPRPIIAFDIGDWVYSMTSTVPERLRVVQWTLTLDINRALAGTVTLNDTVRDAIEKLQERLDAISSGEAVVGTSEPGPQIEDRTPPAAPEGLVASSIAYQDPEMSGGAAGQTLSFVTVGWNPVTTNADGADNPLVQAAVFILDKMEEELANPEVPDPEEEDGGPDYDPILEDWTWKNCPQIVQDFNDALLALWNDDGNPPEIDWLTDYIAETTATPTAAQDVAGYDVRYAYLGLEQVGGIPSSDPFPEDERFYYPATPPEGTSSNQYSFGGVEGGSRLRIEVRAFDRAGNYGAWSTISHDTAADATPPPVPSPPTGLKTWFRTLDVPWDGLGSEGEPMPVDFRHVRVWVGQGADITVPTTPGPLEPTAFDPLETGPQYVANLSAGGTWNVPDLPIGVGYYAALQSVDYTGNASERSDVVGPVTAQQLVGQDLLDGVIDATKLGPNSVDTQHVVNGAITNAQIANATIIAANIGLAQINEAHIESVSAGSIVTGTLFSTVTVAGTLTTSLNPGASRLIFSEAGLQLYRSTGASTSVLVGEWRTSDGSMLVTGTLRSALSGERIHIDPEGSLRFYPPSGTNFSQITNRAGEAVWRGPLDGNQRSGRVNVNMLGVGINFSHEDYLLESIRSEFVLFDRRMRMTAPFIALEVDERNTSPSGDRRIQLSWLNSNGDFLTRSGLSYGIDGSDWGGFYGNDTGWKLARLGPNNTGRFVLTNGELGGDQGVGLARGWEISSSAQVKEGVEDVRSLLDPMQVIRNARARKFRYTEQSAGEPPYVGVIAEELPTSLRREIRTSSGGSSLAVDLGSQLGVVWGALNQLLDQESRSVTGRALVPNGNYRANDVVTVAVTWDEPPLEVPSSNTAIALPSMPTAMGKVRARVIANTVTMTGCQVRLTFEAGPVIVTSSLPIAVEVIGRYIYTPPYVPPED